MGPVRNPYAPGADSPPPEFAGRATIRRDVEVCLERVRLGRPAKSVMLFGLRGVGMIWNPTHGDTAFAVPLFDAFMKRIVPGNDWKMIG
jgi:hypothetical protein